MGFFHVLRHPKQAIKEKAVNAFVMMALRQGLKLGGVAGLLSDSDMEKAAGAVSVLVGLAMSAFNAYRDHQAAKQ